MNRREMINSGFLYLAQALPRLINKSSLSLTGAAAMPPTEEALSFPSKTQEPALPDPKPIREE
jgi:hypothetical protein